MKFDQLKVLFSSFFLSLIFGASDRAMALEAIWNSANDIPMTAGSYDASGEAVNFTLGYAPAIGEQLVVVENTGSNFITGEFTNLSHGDEVVMTFGGESYEFVANYHGGNGNDLVLVWKWTDLTAWGWNSHGQLGDGTIIGRTAPVLVDQTGVLAGKTIISISGGARHSIAVCSDGTVAAWGTNDDGRLGNGTEENSNVPVQIDQSGVLAGKTVVAVDAADYSTMLVCRDGTLAHFGRTYDPEIEEDEFVFNATPVLMDLGGKKAVSVSHGSRHSLVLCTDGSVLAWGENSRGYLGDGTTDSSVTPVPVIQNVGILNGKTVVELVAGGMNVALCSDGTVAQWGYSFLFNPGDTIVLLESLVPIALELPEELTDKTVVSFASNANAHYLVFSDGTVASWGASGKGQLGNGLPSWKKYPDPGLIDQTGVLAGKKVVSINAGDGFALALCSDGTLASWGSNSPFGQLGNGTTNSSGVPILVDQTGVMVGKEPSLVTVGSPHSLVLMSRAEAITTEPEIEVTGPANEVLVDGGSVAFETRAVGAAGEALTFEISNPGNDDLTGLALTLSGANADDFTIDASFFVTTLGPSTSTTFRVTFSPVAAGNRSALLSIASNDADENPFEITLSGDAVNDPAIGAEYPVGTKLVNGAGSAYLSKELVGEQSTSKTFTILNKGVVDLAGLAVVISGPNATDFVVDTSGMSSSLLPSGITTFAMSFTPGGLGERRAQVQITSSNEGEIPFEIDLVGVGATVGDLPNTVSFGTFSLAFVDVLDPGNEADLPDIADNRYGDVSYPYEIGVHEVSEGIIAAANAAGGLGITQSSRGTNLPATKLTWNEAARFVNWLNTSQGHQAAYNFATQPGDVGYDPSENISLWSSVEAWQEGGENLFRHKDARYFLPSEDEWYKAAFYDGSTGTYSNYATGSNSPPTSVDSGPTEGTAVFVRPHGSEPADVMNAGGLSPYGTMAQNGNVWEWVESSRTGANESGTADRSQLGGEWRVASSFLISTSRSWLPPTFVGSGFRVAGFSGIPDSPEIVIEGQSGGDLIDGIASVDMGRRVLGSTVVPQIFTIANSGSEQLTGLTVSLSGGADAADFLVDTETMAVSIAPGESTTFTVSFTPAAIGPKSAQMQIASNDVDENPFEITLTGNATTADALFGSAAAAAGLVDGDAEALAIPFGDGVPNLVKYAFNMDLAGPDGRSMPPGGLSGLPHFEPVEEDGQTYLRLEYVVRKDSGLNYIPQTSIHLKADSFTPMTGEKNITNIDDQWERVVVRQPCSPAEFRSCFVRVKITKDRPDVPEGFALIPAGGFQMGDSFGEGVPIELPVHTVQLSAFYMGKHEVTKSLWHRVRTWGLTHGYPDLRFGDGRIGLRGGGELPTNSISWYDTVKWCNARSEMEGLAPCYTIDGEVYRTGEDDPVCNWQTTGYRLPSEAEWEKAARGGLEGKRYPWGDIISHSQANFKNNGSRAYQTGTIGLHPIYSKMDYPNAAPVGSFAPNGYGLYDMTGNVWEWCWDWTDIYPSSAVTDPYGPLGSFNSGRITRGGGAADSPTFLPMTGGAHACRISVRASSQPGFVGPSQRYFGFRVARSLAP